MSATIAITSAFFAAAFFLYKWLLPKPIIGIPYNEEATKTIFGDLPSMMKHLKTSQVITDWVAAHTERHNSPIVQVFTSIFGKPWVVINDYREAQDILMRRTKEFDKPDFLSDLFYGFNPDMHTVHPSNDRFKSQRKLLQDLMTPTFLNDVAAPQLHDSFLDHIQLWKEKLRLSEGHAFSVHDDIFVTALEAIWATVFGIANTTTITRNQIKMLSPLERIPLPSIADEAATFPEPSVPPAFDAVLKLTDSLESVGKSPLPRVHGFAQRYLPYMIRHQNAKNAEIHAQISKAEARMSGSKGGEVTATNAVDHMLRRERMAAERQNRAPDYHSKVVVAELFGLLIAGHDTTSTTLLWSMKNLANHQSIQQKLRQALFSAFKTQNSVPSAHEIATTQCHYLDACIEELIRCAGTASLPSRRTTTDAVVLGHVIPKDTLVLFCANYAGTRTPAFPIPDSLRSQSYLAAGGGKARDWPTTNMSTFDPDRWLVADTATGEKVFDAMAGPHLQFGAGPRGCFGRRLAYLELRLAIVLVLWHFELQAVPERYAGMEAMEALTHKPLKCYVKLKEVGR